MFTSKRGASVFRGGMVGSKLVSPERRWTGIAARPHGSGTGQVRRLRRLWQGILSFTRPTRTALFPMRRPYRRAQRCRIVCCARSRRSYDVASRTLGTDRALAARHRGRDARHACQELGQRRAYAVKPSKTRGFRHRHEKSSPGGLDLPWDGLRIRRLPRSRDLGGRQLLRRRLSRSVVNRRAGHTWFPTAT